MGGAGEELEEDEYSWATEEPEEREEAVENEIDASKFEKATNSEAGSGSAGFAFIPSKFDGQDKIKQAKKDQTIEDQTVDDLEDWSKKARLTIAENLKSVYQ